MKILKYTILFYLGGMTYLFLEFAWRGYSHGSMFLLGGLCFLLLGQLAIRFPRVSMGWKVILGAALVTALELLTGLAVNRDYSVWDYRQLPFQFLGQISLIYSLLWMPVSLAAMGLYPVMERFVLSDAVSE